MTEIFFTESTMPLAVAQIACDTNADARSVCGRYTLLVKYYDIRFYGTVSLVVTFDFPAFCAYANSAKISAHL